MSVMFGGYPHLSLVQEATDEKTLKARARLKVALAHTNDCFASEEYNSLVKTLEKADHLDRIMQAAISASPSPKSILPVNHLGEIRDLINQAEDLAKTLNGKWLATIAKTRHAVRPEGYPASRPYVTALEGAHAVSTGVKQQLTALRDHFDQSSVAYTLIQHHLVNPFSRRYEKSLKVLRLVTTARQVPTDLSLVKFGNTLTK